MKWSELPKQIKKDIANQVFDLDCPDNCHLLLFDNQIEQLNQMTEAELFEAWCNWHGLINYAWQIAQVYESIFSKGKEN